MILSSKAKDITGLRFNRLVAREPVDVTANGTVRWRCDCDCGSQTIVPSAAIRNGSTQSCGCARVDFATNDRTHGLTKSPTYYTWKSMKARCNNPKSPDYKYYGARGIKVCERWDSFENFLADMGVRPPGKTLDRVRTDDNYNPDNCRWATPKEQANNRRKRQS